MQLHWVLPRRNLKKHLTIMIVSVIVCHHVSRVEQKIVPSLFNVTDRDVFVSSMDFVDP